MKSDERHVYGPRSISALVPRLTRAVFRRRAPATAQVLADWSAIVGPAIGAVTTPRRLSSGTLTIACSGPIAMELQHLAGEVMARINAHLGSQTVTALRFVQTLPQAAPLAPLPPPADPAKLAAVESAVADLPEGELRGALASLGKAMATKSNRSRTHMTLTRRSTLSIAGTALAAGLAGRSAFAAEDLRKAERSLGDPSAKVTVMEFFSLTCSHCAAFARTTMPALEKEMIAPGKVRFVFRDFPLDQIALTAAMVARYLPIAQYYPFVSALLASQDRWAFARGVNNTEEIWKLAALAGMSRQTFDEAVADTDLRNWILQEQKADQDRWQIASTPSFVVNGQKYSGEMSYDAFRRLLPTG